MPSAPPNPAASAGRALKLVAGLLAASLGVGVLAAGVVAPAVAAVGTTANGTVEVFDQLPANLAEQPLSQQSRILYADGSLMATFYYENRVVVPIDRISPNVQNAIVAIEDARFFEHGGVDPEGMGRAFVSNLATSSTQGASTLTQQWIKNVLIEQAVSDLPSSATLEERAAAAQEVAATKGTEGYARKLREVKLAIAAEQSLSKLEILDRYLNIANFGDGQYGIETASKHYFNKSAADLTVAEAALLAGIVQQPGAFNPTENPNDSTARRNVVLGRMLAQGMIDQTAHDEAVNTPLEAMLNVQPTPNGCATAGASAFFCDFAVNQLLDDATFAADPAERQQKLYRGGLTITTTLDPAMQQAAVETVNARVPNDGSGSAASVVSIQPGTGNVKAMAQDRDYTTDPNAPSTATNLNFNAYRSDGGAPGGFQPGSNAKPITLAAYLTQGGKLYDTVPAESRVTWPANTFRYGDCASGRFESPYPVGNSGDGPSSGGQITVLAATYASVNTAYTAIGTRVPLCDIQKTATALGVTQPNGDPINPYPSAIIGGFETAPIGIAGAFATFAAQGVHCDATALTSVTDTSGADVPITPPSCNQALSADVANGVTYALKNVLTTRGATAFGLGLDGRVAAGKTGTTNDGKATWFTGYTPDLATSVWVGRPDNASIDGTAIGGVTRRTYFGATIAAPLWRDYMDRALAGTPASTFTDPPRSIIGTPPAPPAPRPSASSPSSGSTTQAPTPPADTAPAPAPEAPAPTEAPAAQ